jgi:hypothetical protein
MEADDWGPHSWYWAAERIRLDTGPNLEESSKRRWHKGIKEGARTLTSLEAQKDKTW